MNWVHKRKQKWSHAELRFPSLPSFCQISILIPTSETPKPLFKTISYLAEFSIFLLSPPLFSNIQNKIYYRKKCSNINIFSLVPLLDFWWFLTFSLEISHTKGSNISLEWLSTFHFLFLHFTSWHKNGWKMSKILALIFKLFDIALL